MSSRRERAKAQACQRIKQLVAIASKPKERKKDYGISIYLCSNELVGSRGHHLASDQDAQR